MTTISQLPATVHLHFVQGDTFRRRLHFYNESGDVDISTWTITAQVRPYPVSELSEDFATTVVTDGTDGLVDIELTHDQARRLDERSVWDFQYDDGSTVLTLLVGTVTVDREVTR